MQRKAQPVHMKKGEGMTEHIGCADLPDMNDVFGIMDQVFMGKNGTFWFSGGAGGLDNKARIIRFDVNPGVFFGSGPEKINILIGFLGINNQGG